MVEVVLHASREPVGDAEGVEACEDGRSNGDRRGERLQVRALHDAGPVDRADLAIEDVLRLGVLGHVDPLADRGVRLEVEYLSRGEHGAVVAVGGSVQRAVVSSTFGSLSSVVPWSLLPSYPTPSPFTERPSSLTRGIEAVVHFGGA